MGAPLKCEVVENNERCPTRAQYRGMCQKHYKRWQRHGDPTYANAIRFLPGEKHPMWVHSTKSYTIAHDRVRRAKGKASTHPCVDCGEPAHEWSYDRLDPNEQVDIVDMRGQQLFVRYSKLIHHYHARCKPCHRIFDRAIYMAFPLTGNNVTPEQTFQWIANKYGCLMTQEQGDQLKRVLDGKAIGTVPPPAIRFSRRLIVEAVSNVCAGQP